MHTLHPRLHLTFVPGFPGFRRHSSGQNFDANALAAQDVLQSLGDVALLRVDRENLHPSSPGTSVLTSSTSRRSFA